MDKLRKLLKDLAKPIAAKHHLSDECLLGLFSVYPFNEFEYLISHLLAENVMGAFAI